MVFSGLSKYKNAALLVMRTGIGIAMTLHGYPKISGGEHVWHEVGKAMGVFGITFLPTFWGFMAAITEFLGGILFIIGLAFRPACILLAFVMLVVILGGWKNHSHYDNFLHPLELFVVFISLLFLGPGRYSADGK